jgi:hypothetical protein
MKLTSVILSAAALVNVANAQTPTPKTVSVMDYGAVCNGSANDTTAIQSALNTGLTVSLPQGTCRVTAPLVIDSGASTHNYGSLKGEGANYSAILADYSAWVGTDYTVLKLSTTSGRSGTYTELNRVFQGFAIRSGGANAVQGIAIKIQSSASFTVGNALPYSPAVKTQFRDILINDFDTALSISEAWESVFDSINVQGCRQGIVIAGKSVNDFFTNLKMSGFTTANTSNSGGTVGFSITKKLYSDGYGIPEGISVSHSLIFGAGPNVALDEGLYLSITDNIIDGTPNNGIFVNNPNSVVIARNYIAVASGNSGVLMAAPPVHLDGIWIVDNHFMGNGGFGIYNFSGGNTRRGMQIRGNRFTGLVLGMQFGNIPQYSVIKDNFGAQNTGNFITLLGPGGYGTIVQGNRSADNVAILYCPSSTSVTASDNLSASGWGGSCN